MLSLAVVQPSKAIQETESWLRHPCGADEMQDAKAFESGLRSIVPSFVIGLEHVKK